MRITHLLSVLAVGVVFAGGSLVGCGSDAPSPTPAPVAPVDAGPTSRDAPTQLVASTNLADLIRLTWIAPAQGAGLTGYVILRDGKVLAQLPASDSSYDDRTAVAATLLPPELSASDGTRETGIEVSWKPLGAGGVPALHGYAVKALYGTEESAPSEPAQGSRTGIVTGYEVSQDGGAWTPVPGSELRFEDTNAPRAKVTFPIPQVEDDFKRSAVRLELPTHPVVGLMPPRTYRVRAVSATAKGDPSLPATGKRKTGLGDRIPLQWQRSATPADGSYADIPGVTGRVWIDANAPTNEARFFRARVDAPWAEGVSSARAARATAWRAISRSAHSCGLDAADGKMRCWGDNSLGQAPPGPSADSYVSVLTKPGVTCAIRASDSRAVCFGQGSGALSWEAPPDPVRSLTGYGNAMCGLRLSDSSVVCWGLPFPWFEPSDAAQSYTSFELSAAGPCAIRSADHRLKCWGDPWTIPDDAFVRIAAGSNHVCGIRELDGKLRCWARPAYSTVLLPGTSAPTLESYSDLAANGESTCAIRSRDRQLECWGGGGYSEGPGINKPPVGRMKAVAPTLPGGASALREDGRLVNWGYDYDMGARPLGDADGFSTLAVADSHGCGIRASDGKLSCWPEGFGALEGNVSYKAVAVDTASTCALRASDGRPVCNAWFGSVSVTDPLDSISVKEHRACGVRSADKKVVCWDGVPPTFTPPQDLPDDALLSIAAGKFHGCGIRVGDRRLVCWGMDIDGAAPPGPSTVDYLDVLVNVQATCTLRASDGVPSCQGPAVNYFRGFPGRDYRALAGHFCAIRASDDRVACSADALTTATQTGPSSYNLTYDPFLEVKGASHHVCGIRASDRKLICWGESIGGQAPRP